MNDYDLNHEICSLWGIHHRGDRRPPNHDMKNFAFVNDLLQDRGCRLYGSYGEKKCKHTDSSSKSSSDCSEQGIGRSALDKRSGKKSKLQEDWENQNKLKTRAVKRGTRGQR